MGKRPAGARHIRTSAPATASPVPGISRIGALPEPTDEAALDGLLSPDGTVPLTPGQPLLLVGDPAAADSRQAALDLDAILSMAFGPETIPDDASSDSRSTAAAGSRDRPGGDDLLDDLLGDWDIGGGSDDPADDFFLPDGGDLDAPFVFPRPPPARIDDAEVVADSTAVVPVPPPQPPADQAVAALQDDVPPALDVLPDLDLDDLFDPAPPPAPPRARPRVDDGPAAPTVGRPVRENRRAAVPELDRVLQIGAARPTLWSTWWPRLIWAALLAGLVYVAFLPYQYEVGGDFVVQPLQRSEARSRTDGEIIAVNVKEGDWVTANDILAVLSNVSQLKDVALNQSDDAKLRADLATMENGAKPEEIAVARESVVSADRVVAVAQKDLDRQQALFNSGTIAEKVLETARNARDAAVSARDEAAAKLALVSSPAKPTEIDAQKAAIARNQQELDFARLLLEYANIRAPQEGQIVSPLSTVPVGAFLPQGGLFAELENNRTVIAEVDMPETSIKEVAIGARAELRLWSDPETSIFGTVSSIAPRAEQRDFGWVIRVEVEVPNPDGRLAANMTGFGKVAAAERPVWQAFTEAIVGFFKIELWSWVP